MTKERLQIAKTLSACKLTSILAPNSCSKLSKAFVADLRKIIPCNTSFSETQTAQLSKAMISSVIQKQWHRQWHLHLQMGHCTFGNLNCISLGQLKKAPPPLNLSRKQFSPLANILNGHTCLQQLQYVIHNRFTPVCTCLKEKETHHFLFACEDYVGVRCIINPTNENWDSILHYNAGQGNNAANGKGLVFSCMSFPSTE